MFFDSDSLAVFTIDSSNGNYNTSLISIDLSGNMRRYSLGSNTSHILAASKSFDNFVLLGIDIQGGFRISKFDQFLSNIWSVSYSGITLYESFPLFIENMQIDRYGCIYVVGNGGYTYIAAYKLLPNGQVPVADEVQAPPVNAISAYPNPAKGFLTIELDYGALSTKGTTDIEIYNLRGQKVKTFQVEDTLNSSAKVVWDRRDRNGKNCTAGIYFVRDSHNPGNTKKFVLLK
ncbi:MAG: T9SS type A sorting domain-containing protein [Candidatus Cloacimonetes bacterium]|nr:T9SS type A sorting domain-containing protein [Candidatus Cloacimonadota bacterium]